MASNNAIYCSFDKIQNEKAPARRRFLLVAILPGGEYVRPKDEPWEYIVFARILPGGEFECPKD